MAFTQYASNKFFVICVVLFFVSRLFLKLRDKKKLK